MQVNPIEKPLLTGGIWWPCRSYSNLQLSFVQDQNTIFLMFGKISKDTRKNRPSERAKASFGHVWKNRPIHSGRGSNMSNRRIHQKRADRNDRSCLNDRRERAQQERPRDRDSRGDAWGRHTEDDLPPKEDSSNRQGSAPLHQPLPPRSPQKTVGHRMNMAR